MASFCQMCGKGKQHGNLVSHAKNRVRRIWRPNLQVVRVTMEGVTAKLMVCTRCLRLVKREQQDRQKQEKVAAAVAAVG